MEIDADLVQKITSNQIFSPVEHEESDQTIATLTSDLEN
jgi:hypothetical protein